MSLSAFQFNRRVLLILVVAVPVVIAVVFDLISVELTADQERAYGAIRHTHEKRQSIGDLNRALQAAESSRRGYLLSGNPRYLLAYRYARIEALLALPYLERLMDRNLPDSTRLVDLRTFVHECFARMQQTMDLLASHRREEALQAFDTQDVLNPMRRIHAMLEWMHNEEEALLLQQRTAAHAKETLRTNLFTVLLFLAAAVVAGAGLLMLRIQQLHSIITICAWTQRVNYNGRWMRMEDFLWERFRVKVSHGISEEAFDGVMGIVGKNLTVSDHRGDRTTEAKHDDGRQPTRCG